MDKEVTLNAANIKTIIMTYEMRRAWDWNTKERLKIVPEDEEITIIVNEKQIKEQEK